MNNTEIVSDQYSNYHNRPQSLIKLPIIFASMMVFFAICLSAFYYIRYSLGADNEYISVWQLFYFLGNGVINQLLNYSIFYFCIGLIMCIDQKMHQVTLRNVLCLLVISIIYLFANYLFSTLYSTIYTILIEQFGLSYVVISMFSPLISFFLGILNLLILIGSFKLMGAINHSEQPSYVIEKANQQTLLALLFMVIFCLPSMMILLPMLPSMISGLLLAYTGIDIFGSNLFITINVLFVPALVTFFAIMISFMIVYFSVKSCFIRQFSTIPLKLLLKAVGWAYLYLIIFNIVVSLIYFIVSFSITSSMTSYHLMATVAKLTMVFSLICIVINIVGTIILCRKAVRKYFS